MRKLMIRLLIIVCVFGLVGCQSQIKTFQIADAQKVVIISGNTGQTVECNDLNMIQKLTDNINSIQFEQGETSQNSTGWSYRIIWLDKSDQEIEEIVVNSSDTIIYEDYFWNTNEGTINIDIIDELLNEER